MNIILSVNIPCYDYLIGSCNCPRQKLYASSHVHNIDGVKISAIFRRYFQMHFRELKPLNHKYNIIEICSLSCTDYKWQYFNTGSGNSLKLTRRQAITWANKSWIFWCIYASLGLEESLVSMLYMTPYNNFIVLVFANRGRDNIAAIFQMPISIFFQNENVWISIKISLKFVPKGPIKNIPALVQIMAWRRPDDTPLAEPMMASLLMHICVTRPQWFHNVCFDSMCPGCKS